ncbi:hypothetical protein WHK34_14485, partial [Staphylococcus aureus]|uniref:hypothetical protein n=1 Tax=Staphylococcus aureus TaxID=1280 RepID=UPI0039BDA6C3
NHMALTSTTLASAMAASDTVAVVTSATGFAAGNVVQIDGEWMVVDRSYVSGVNIPVFRRGDQGTRVVAHNALAVVVTGLSTDLVANSSANDT